MQTADNDGEILFVDSHEMFSIDKRIIVYKKSPSSQSSLMKVIFEDQ